MFKCDFHFTFDHHGFFNSNARFILKQGLLMVGFDHHCIQKVLRTKNVIRFRSFFGSDPIVYATIWNNLYDETSADACINTPTATLKHFLMSVYFLKCYPNEMHLSGTFCVCKKTACKWCWYFLSTIQALKHTKVSHKYSLYAHCYFSTTTKCQRCLLFCKVTWPTEWTQGHPDFCSTNLPVFFSQLIQR